MKPKKDPIKPNKGLNKKINFRKERLDVDYFNMTRFLVPHDFAPYFDPDTDQFNLVYDHHDYTTTSEHIGDREYTSTSTVQSRELLFSSYHMVNPQTIGLGLNISVKKVKKSWWSRIKDILLNR